MVSATTSFMANSAVSHAQGRADTLPSTSRPGSHLSGWRLSTSRVVGSVEGPALKNSPASFSLPQSTWYSEALENGKRWQIWLTKKQRWFALLIERSDEPHWDTSMWEPGQLWDTTPFEFKRVPWQRHLFLKGLSRLQVTDWELEESSMDRTFTWSSQCDWNCGHPQPGVTQKAKWCSRQCLLLDWQASCMFI